jgi:hypothetical protein
MQVQSATVAGVLQAGPITGTSLSLTGGATVGGTLTANGKITGNGLDAGTGGLSTTGNITAAGLAASSIDDSGALSAGPASFSSLTVSGSVNFSGASVSGLNVSNLNLAGVTLQTLNVGTPSGTTAPLNISENGHTAQIGVNSNGSLSLTDASVAGSLAVGGAIQTGSGVTASTLQGTPSAGTSAPGPLTLQGNGITLAGNTTLSGGNNLLLSTSGSNATHVLSSGDRDVAGTATVHVTSGSTPAGDFTTTVSFIQPYTAAPVVVLTPATDPDPDQDAMPKVWVTLQFGTGQYTGFTIHYRPFGGKAATSHDVTFNYHVIG